MAKKRQDTHSAPAQPPAPARPQPIRSPSTYMDLFSEENKPQEQPAAAYSPKTINVNTLKILSSIYIGGIAPLGKTRYKVVKDMQTQLVESGVYVNVDDHTDFITKSFSETSRLFDWGFDSFVSKRIIAESDPICEVPVALSGQANYVVAHPANDLTRMMPDDLNPEDLTRDVELYHETVDAPIAAGAELGKLTLSHDGKVYGEVALLALSDVSASWVLVAQRNVKNFFSQTWVKLVCIVLVLLVAALVIYSKFFSRSRRYGRRRRGYSRSGYRGRRR